MPDLKLDLHNLLFGQLPVIFFAELVKILLGQVQLPGIDSNKLFHRIAHNIGHPLIY